MATVNADCIVGENSFLSSHVIINRGIHITSNTIIYSGSVVTKSFKESGIALRGIPAKIVV
jgi:acetyltransferase-like isoleucine patch superfamily enzyme